MPVLDVKKIRFLGLLLVASLLGACSPDSGGTAGDGSVTPTDGGGTDAPLPPDARTDPRTDAGTGICPRVPPSPDRTRPVVISHPFDSGGGRTNGYELLNLSTAGEFTATGTRFSMGRSFMGDIAFTPDGEIGVVAQDDGSIGIFRLLADGSVEVIRTAMMGDYYAKQVVMDPSGERVLVVDSQWASNGGGVYEIAIDCEGQPEDRGQLISAQLPYGLGFPLAGRAVVAAKGVPDMNTDGHELFLFDWKETPDLLLGTDLWGDDEGIFAGLAFTPDGRFALVGDLSSDPNRVAVAAVGTNSLTPLQVLTPVADPVAIVVSPFDDVAIVVSGFDNAIVVLDREDSDSAPFRVRGELSYIAASPQLPGSAIAITEGPMRGHVFIAENVGIHHIKFEGGGVVTDLGAHILGSGTEFIVGTLGIAP